MLGKKTIAFLSLITALNSGSDFSLKAQNVNKEMVSKDILLTLDSKVFQESEDTVFFKDWLEMNSFIKPIFLDSAGFDVHKDSIIKKEGLQYVLYLPIDMHIGDVPNIISQINEFSFGKKMTRELSSEELRLVMKTTIDYIKMFPNLQKHKEIQNIIRKYDGLECIGVDKIYKNKLDGIKEDTVENIQNILSLEIKKYLYESIFENGAQIVADIPNIKKLLPMQKYKEQLESSAGDSVLLLANQKRIINEIMSIIHSSPFFKTDKNTITSQDCLEQSSPSKISKTGKIQCVGYSILIHRIFQELGITYSVFTMMEHSSVLVLLSDGNPYVVDIKDREKIELVKVVKAKGQIADICLENNNIVKICYGDPENVLVGQLFMSMAYAVDGEDKWNRKEKLILKALDYDPNNIDYIKSLFYVYIGMKKRDKALAMCDRIESIDYDITAKLLRDILNKRMPKKN